MKKTLLEAVRESQSIEDRIIESGGEITPQLEAALLEIDLSLGERVDATQIVLDRLAGSAEYWRLKAREFERIAAALEAARGRLRTHVKNLMLASRREELPGLDTRFRLSAHRSRLVFDEALVPDAYKKQVMHLEVDLVRLREDLERGIEVRGASLEPVHALRSYPNTKSAPRKAA